MFTKSGTTQKSLFLSKASLTTRLLALLIMGGGPFACRQWGSLAVLTLLSVFVGFSRSIRSFFIAAFGILVALLFLFVRTSSFLETHPHLKGAFLVFSAYGVALYALTVISPHITSGDMLDASRTCFRPIRNTLVIISHVVVLFLKGHSGIILTVSRNLRASGVKASILRPETAIKFLIHFLTSLWLYLLVQSEAYSIAVDSRLTPFVRSFLPRKTSVSAQSVVVGFVTLIAAYIIVADFVSGLFI